MVVAQAVAQMVVVEGTEEAAQCLEDTVADMEVVGVVAVALEVVAAAALILAFSFVPARSLAVREAVFDALDATALFHSDATALESALIVSTT